MISGWKNRIKKGRTGEAILFLMASETMTPGTFSSHKIDREILFESRHVNNDFDVTGKFISRQKDENVQSLFLQP